MKRDLLKLLQYQGHSNWNLEVIEEDAREVRRGTIQCKTTGVSFPIEDGIVNMIQELPPEVLHEKEHAEKMDYIVTQNGEKHPVNRENIRHFQSLLLSLPAGDGSAVFKPGGSFDNQAGNAERFFKTLDLLNLTGKERILEVGTSFGWGAWRFAQRGCEVVALDVTNYMMAADLYFEDDGCYFDRVMSDMSRLPFASESFDIIFSHSVIHHCKDLGKLFAEFHRVLRPGGKVVALHECSFGIFEDKSGKALQEAIHEGFNENAYTIPEWKEGARKGGFGKVKLHFFSFIDDYLYRKKLRGAQETSKIRFAKWIQSHPLLHHCINQISILPRIVLRPKAWMLIATKT